MATSSPKNGRRPLMASIIGGAKTVQGGNQPPNSGSTIRVDTPDSTLSFALLVSPFVGLFLIKDTRTSSLNSTRTWPLVFSSTTRTLRRTSAVTVLFIGILRLILWRIRGNSTRKTTARGTSGARGVAKTAIVRGNFYKKKLRITPIRSRRVGTVTRSRFAATSWSKR